MTLTRVVNGDLWTCCLVSSSFVVWFDHRLVQVGVGVGVSTTLRMCPTFEKSINEFCEKVHEKPDKFVIQVGCNCETVRRIGEKVKKVVKEDDTANINDCLHRLIVTKEGEVA